MRRIINSTYITVDGRVEDPQLWPSTGERDPQFEAIQTDLLLSCDVLVMGRRTYDVFASSWPTRSGDPMADQFNTMRKYVVSTTETEPTWENTQVLTGDVAAQLAEIKATPGKDIVQYGIGPVTRLMIEHGLLDELRLWVHPLIIGGTDRTDFVVPDAAASLMHLRDATTLAHGIVLLTYDFPAAA